jgi:hypothetical protein
VRFQGRTLRLVGDRRHPYRSLKRTHVFHVLEAVDVLLVIVFEPAARLGEQLADS